MMYNILKNKLFGLKRIYFFVLKDHNYTFSKHWKIVKNLASLFRQVKSKVIQCLVLSEQQTKHPV